MADLKNIFPSEIIENSVEKHFQEYSPGKRVLYLVVLVLFFVTMILMFIIKVDISVHSVGTIRPLENRTDIRPPVNGVIDSIFVTENMHVVAGQPLMKIHSQSVDNQSHSLSTQHEELADEVADLNKLLAGGNVDSLKSSLYPQQYQLYRQKLKDAQNKFDLVSKDFRRYSTLYQSHVISAEEYDKYDYEMKSAQNDLRTVQEQQYSQWQSDLTRIKLQMQDMNSQLGQYEEQKDLHTIKAPVSGHVQQLKGVQHGSVVTPNDVLGEISPDSGMIAEVYVLPKDIGYVRVGTPVRIQIDAFDYNMWGMITGSVTSVSNDIFTDGGQPYFKVRCKLDAQELQLKNGYKGYLKKGMTLQVRFFVTKRTISQLLYDKTDDWLNPNLVTNGQSKTKGFKGFIDGLQKKLSKFLPFLGTAGMDKKVTIRQHDMTDCGAACLASVTTYYGLQVPIARIRQYAGTDKKGTNILGLVEAATKLGLSAKAVKGPFESIYTIPYPTIAHVVINNILHHYVVVYGASEDGIKVMDPGSGTMTIMPVEEFKKIWTGILLLLAPIEEFRQGDETVSVISRFMYLLKPHRSMLIQILVGSVVYTVLGLATAIYMQKVIDNVLPEGNRNLLNLMSLIMIVIVLVQLFINFTKTILTIKTGQQIDARLILGYYKHLLKLPQQFFDTMRTGEIISRMNDAVKIRAFINDVLISLAVNMFILIFSFALMFTSYWKLALVMLTVVPMYGIIYYFSNKINKKTQRKLMEATADLESQLVESINSVGTIKRFGIEGYSNLKTETRFIKLLKTIYNSATNSLWIGNAGSFVSGMFSIILLWLGATFVLDNALTPGELLSFYAIMGYFTGPVISLIGMNKTMQDALIAADRLFEIMDLERESEENKTILNRDMIGDITFKDVHFRYGTRVNVFNGLNLQIPKGKITAVVGESGSGKTTLLSLLQNIYPLLSGSVLIGGFDIKYITNDSLRELVSVVPQKVDLFAGTVMENIALGEFQPDMKRVFDICKQIGILEFIESLPNGFLTFLSENGTNLSGGQRQRLAIARALYKDPEILILDEATSSLDSLSEKHIQDAINDLRKQNKTIIIIAHRLSTVMNADKIIVLQNGEIMEQGGHEDLLKEKKYYYSMWEQQFPMISQLLAEKAPRKTVKAKVEKAPGEEK